MKTVRTLRVTLLLASSAAVFAVPAVAQTTSSRTTRAPAATQTAPASQSSNAMTRNLNGSPPAQTAPVITPPRTTPAAAPTAAPRAATTTAPATTPARQSAAPSSTPAVTPRQTAPSSSPSASGAMTYPAPTLPGSRPAATAPATSATAQPAAPAASAVTAPPPTMTVLSPTAVAALPFTVELPQGFRITSGRPGPDFNIYTIRRGDQSFAMVYVGPSSQFPIYDGEMVQTGGRSSIVVNEGGQRHAKEHLFQRTASPREVHVWVSSLDGADAALSERIAQSVDAK